MSSRCVVAVPALLLVVAGLLAGCDDDGARSPAGFDDGLEALPGVVEAGSELVDVDDGVQQLQVEVVVDEDASVTQVVGVVDAVAEHDEARDPDTGYAISLHRDGTEEHALSWAYDPPEDVEEAVSRWTLAGEQLPDDLAWTADGYGQIVVDVGDEADAEDVAATAELIAADTELAALPRWSLRGKRSPDDEENFAAALSLATDAGLTTEVVAWWRRAAALADLAPGTVTTLALEPRNRAGSYSADPPPRGSMSVWLALQLPGVVPPADLTPARWGDRLWPLLRAELDLVRDLPPGSGAGANNHYLESADSPSFGSDAFFGVRDGEPAEPDDLGRGWNEAGLRYLEAGR